MIELFERIRNNRGVHGAPSYDPPQSSEWDWWISELQAMHIAWYKLLDNGHGSSLAFASKLLENGIVPIVRVHRGEPYPGTLPADHLQTIRAYIAAGIILFETGNQPNLPHEWKSDWRDGLTYNSPEHLNTVVDGWVADAQQVLDAGGYPSFPALAPTDRNGTHPTFSSVMWFGKMMDRLKDAHHTLARDLFARGAWLAVHSSPRNRSFDFDPNRGNFWDDCCLQGYQVYLTFLEQKLNVRGVPVIFTEGGVYTPERMEKDGWGRSYEYDSMAEKTLETYNWLARNAPQVIAVCPWILANRRMGHHDKRWDGDEWYRPDEVLPVAAKLKAAPPVERVERTFRILGRVIDVKTQLGVAELRVEAWDKDTTLDDPVGDAVTGEQGAFQIRFGESAFNDRSLDQQPDLYFRVFRGDELIKSTENSVLWDVEREDIEVLIEVGDSTDEEVETAPRLQATTRSILQATYTPRKPRPGEDPLKAPRGLEKGVFLARLAPSQEELGELTSRYKKESGQPNAAETAVNRKALKAVEILTDASSQTGKINALRDAKQFFGLHPDTIVRVARDLVDLRRKTLTISEINRFRNLVNTFEKNMETEPVGYLHLERMSFTPAGIERGGLVHSVPLSPGEEVNIRQREWSRTSEEFERIVADYLEEFSEEGVTEKTELAQSVNSQKQHSNAFNTAVSTSGEAWGFSITASVGYNASESASKSEQITRNHTRELTSKASSRSKQEHKISFRVASARETEDETVQRIKNPFPDRATRVDYYQLMRKWQVDLFRYGIRLTWDITVFEPGAGLLAKLKEIHSLQQQLTERFDLEALLGISASDISLDPESKDEQGKSNYYGDIVLEHGITLTESPPPLYDKLEIQFDRDCTDSFGTDSCEGGWPDPIYETIMSEKIEPGYEACGESDKKAKISITQSWRTSGGKCDHYLYSIIDRLYGSRLFEIKGGKHSVYKKHPGAGWERDEIEEGNAWKYSIDEYGQWAGCQEQLGVIVKIWNMAFVGFSIVVPLRLKSSVEQEWKQKVWNQIHEFKRAEYYEERQMLRDRLAQLQEELGAQDALSLRQKEREEVMKGVLEYLGIPPGEHRVDWTVKFIHHAIEWENILYFLYPYFWSDPEKWEFKKYLDHPDPMHRSFLKAGAARVVLTIRPGFEDAFMKFMEDPFTPPEELSAPYLEIAREFEAYAKTNYPGIPPANPVENFRPLLTHSQKKAWRIMQLHIRLLEVFYRTNRRYPSTGEGLSAIAQVFPMKDPWDHDYVYVCPGQHPDIIGYDLASYGADGAPGGDGEDADIVNWDPAFLKDLPEQVQTWEDIQLIAQLLDEYHRVHERYPSTEEGLEELKKLIPLKDPWGRDYVYTCPGVHADYELVSYGEGGVPGGDGEDADITSWAEASLIGQWYEYTPTSALDIAFDEGMPQA